MTELSDALIAALGGSITLFFYGLARLTDAVGAASPAFTGQPAREAAYLDQVQRQ